MKIFKIVLTGGPCAGKTTAVNVIKKHLRELKIPCVIVPETATELIPNFIDDEIDDLYNFQKLIMKRQLVKEDDAFDYVKNKFQNKDKCVIIYDRGIVDNLAYLNDINQYRKMLNNFLLGEMQVLDRYDLVLDLLSLATCKSNEYNCLNNNARKETSDLAALVDYRTSMAWANHHNLRILSSEVSLQEELKSIIDMVDNLIFQNEVVKRERYLIDLDRSDLSQYNTLNYLDVCEHHFQIDDNNYIKCVVSVRYKRDASYLLELYKEENNQKIIVYREIIDSDDLGTLCRKSKFIGGAKKREINFIDNKVLYSLSIYDDRAYLEVQNNNCDKEIIIPQGICLSKESIINNDSINKSIEYVRKLIK